MRRMALAAMLLIAGCAPKALTPGSEAMVYIAPEVLAEYPALRDGVLDPGSFEVIHLGLRVRYVGETTVRSGRYATVNVLEGPMSGRTVHVRPDYLRPL